MPFRFDSNISELGIHPNAESRSWRVFSWLLVIVLLAVAFPEMAPQALQGILWTGAGLLMVLLPPEVRVPKAWIFLALGFVGCATIGFLPREWFHVNPWRSDLDALGLDTGGQVFVEVPLAAEALAGFAVTAVVVLFMLGHRIGTRLLHWLAIGFILGVAAWTMAALMAHKPGGLFGFFPNRNHTASLLVIASFAGLGAFAQAVQLKSPLKIVLSVVPTCLTFWILFAVSESRAGIVLAGFGILAWLALTGPKSFRGNTGKALILLAIAAGGAFLIVDSTVKQRLTKTVEKLAPVVVVDAGASGTPKEDSPFTGAPAAQVEPEMDGRVTIFLDTLSMVASEPWSGVGPGQFVRVFPQYWIKTSASSDSQVLHPESDWLMMLSETGWPATLCLAVGVMAVFFTAFRQVRQGRSTFLRSGCVVAALLLCVHGIFDVPGHRVGLAWAAALLLAAALRFPGAEDSTLATMPSRFSRGVWRALGCVIFSGGLVLLVAQVKDVPLLPSVRFSRHMRQAKILYDQDQAAYDKAVAEDHEYQPSPEQDPLEEALRELNAAILIAPLDPYAHFVRGALALHFDDKQEIARHDFAIQRRLVPGRVNLAMEQAQAWKKQSPKETGPLWTEALRRARIVQARFPASPNGVTNTFSQAIRDAGKDETLSAVVLQVAGDDPKLIALWAHSAPASLLDLEMPRLLPMEIGKDTREALFAIWKKNSNTERAATFAKNHPELDLAPE